MYPLKSGWNKRKERMTIEARQNNGQAGQQEHFQVGLLGFSPLQVEDSPDRSVSKEEEEEAGKNPYSSVSSFGEKISMIPIGDGSKTGEELPDDRSESMNAKTITRLDIGCITDEVPTQAGVEKYITIGHIPLTKQFPNDLNKQVFQYIALKIGGTNGAMYKREFLVWSQVKDGSC